MNAPQEDRLAFSAATVRAQEIVWHDLECGSYRADLPLWRELAAEYSGRILDVGAGTGRVTLDLARAGHHVTALDHDRDLLHALDERAGDLNVETVRADARSLELSRHDFGLCIVAMQTIQLLGGRAERIEFLGRARAHLRRGGLLACAILTTVEPFDCAEGDVGPSAETAYVDGVLYISRATRVAALERTVVIERERRIAPPGKRGTAGVSIIELDGLSASQLEREAVEAGLSPYPAREVAPTEDHVGSAVVMLRV